MTRVDFAPLGCSEWNQKHECLVVVTGDATFHYLEGYNRAVKSDR